MKKLIMTMLIVTILLYTPNLVFAEPVTQPGTGGMTRTTVVDDLGDLDKYKGASLDSNLLNTKVGTILGWIRAIGTVLSVVILIIIGIKYLFGSVEEKADYKKSLIPYIVGAAILFTGTTIPQLIYELVNQI